METLNQRMAGRQAHDFPGVADEDYATDAALVRQDLATLKEVLETSLTAGP